MTKLLELTDRTSSSGAPRQLLISKAPRATLSLLATFFPAPKGGSLPLSPDSNYPVPHRGLACLPPPTKAPPHPLLAFFPPAKLPELATVTVLSPHLTWCATNAPRSDGHASKPASPRKDASPAVLVRILRRAEALDLSVKWLGLVEMHGRWEAVPEAKALASLAGAQSIGLSVCMELHGVHAVSRWADAVGPSEAFLEHLSLGAASSCMTGLKPRERFVEADMRCLRGAVGVPGLPDNDLGLYTAQSASDALGMAEMLVPPGRPLPSATGGPSKEVTRGPTVVETACLVTVHQVNAQAHQEKHPARV